MMRGMPICEAKSNPLYAGIASVCRSEVARDPDDLFNCLYMNGLEQIFIGISWDSCFSIFLTSILVWNKKWVRNFP
jgi:hypothetical protein